MSDKTFTPFHLSVSDVQEVFRNVDFPHTQKINNLQKFQDATKFDHCVAKFVDDKRAKRNFITADCIFLDIDNDDTLNPQEWDDPKLWMTLARFRKNFEGIEHIIQPSKSHRKEKDGRQQRDRFHVYFPLNHIISSGKDYEEHINLLVSLYVRPDGISFFDTKAVDCSRLFYGNKKGIASAPEWYKGKSVLDWMADHPQTKIIKEQNHKKNTLPGVGSIQGSSQESQGKHLWMAGWQYKKLIKGNPVEIFYGDLSIKTENETSWSVRCSSGKHEDKEASLQIDKMTYSWNCWAGCGKGNVFDFIAMRDNNHKDNVVDDFCNILGVRNPNKSKGIDGEVMEEDEKTPADLIVDTMNENHAVIQSGSNVGIMCWSKIKRTMGGQKVVYPELHITKQKDFHLLYLPYTLQVNEKPITHDEIFLRSPNRNQYNGLEFDPTSNERPKKGEPWNIWIDWYTGKSGYRRWIDESKYDKYTDWKEASKDCGWYLEHIKQNICGGVDESRQMDAYKWVLYWMADCLVNPTRRDSAVCLALRGGQGSGKGQFVEKFAEFFGTHYLHITDSEQLTQEFNWQLKDNLLIFSDEATFAADRKQASKIKGLITGETREVRKLFQDKITLPNYSRLIMASNDDWMLPSDDDDRRYFVLDVGEGWKQDHEKFSSMNKEWNSGGREAFLYFLIEGVARGEDFGGYDFQKEKFITKAHMEQIRQSNPITDWYMNVLDVGYFEYKDKVGDLVREDIPESTEKTFWNINDIHQDYQNYMKTGGSGGSRYLQRVAQFSMSLNKLIGNKKLFDNNYRRDRMIEPAQYDDNNNRLRKKSTGWKFGSLNALRNHWERRNGLDRWTGQKVLTESTQGIIEELSLGDNNTTSEIEVKRKKKLVGDITSLIVD